MIKRIILPFMFLVISIQWGYGQDSCKSQIDLGSDLVSRYVWRGTDYGRSPSIQPWMEYQVNNFTLGTWAAFTATNELYQEIDFYASYTFSEKFKFTFTDYFSGDFSQESVSFFDFNKKTTSHLFEGMFEFLGTENFPLSFTTGVMFWGNDKDTVSFKNYYSTYLELCWSGSHKDVDYEIFIGGSPLEGLYSSNAAIVNTGVKFTKELKISEDYSLPVYTTFALNPYEENVFLVFGLTF